MQALELGDKENYIPDASSPSSFGSDSPMMTRSPKPGGSRRRASRAPRGSLLDAQTTVDSDVDDHQKSRLHFSADHPCSFDCKINVVGEVELRKYRSRFEIPDSMILMLPSSVESARKCDRHLWCHAQLWGNPSPPAFHRSRDIFPLSLAVENWIPEGAANPRQVEVSSDEKKKGFIWGFPTSNKRWKNNWFFVGGEWGRDVPASGRRNFSVKKVPRHFTSPKAWSKAIPILLDGEISHLAVAAVLPLDERG
ncbi:hypothetical protein Q3G72_024083 [Acer saccharum]|nr:hypothetical protein Q3G72_024083 [Acer saccharum]